MEDVKETKDKRNYLSGRPKVRGLKVFTASDVKLATEVSFITLLNSTRRTEDLGVENRTENFASLYTQRKHLLLAHRV